MSCLPIFYIAHDVTLNSVGQTGSKQNVTCPLRVMLACSSEFEARVQSAADKARLIMQSPDGHARYPLLPSISPACPLSLLPGILEKPARLSAMHYGGLVCVLLCVCALIQGRLVCVLIEGLCVC